MNPIRIALVDDHVLFRKGMAALLSEEGKVKVVFEAGSGLELLEKLVLDQPDLVLMDLEMPGMDGLEATQKIKQLYPDLKVIVITMHESDRFISKLMEAGASAYLLKNSDMGEAVAAIESVMETGFYFSERVSQAMLAALVHKNRIQPTFSKVDPLTEREIEVLKRVCEEKNSEEIGEELFISPRTVEGYRRKLLEKTGAKNLAGLVVYAIKHGHYLVPE
ncbi:MAG: response regulator transcription factor [Bacteroidia bacterium]|nr:response regulator transcription factor [Bacteroidia bacterium]